MAETVSETALVARKSIGLITEEELAAMLGLKSVTTLATWRSQREGPAHVKLGKGVFYRVADVQAWVNKRASESCAA